MKLIIQLREENLKKYPENKPASTHGFWQHHTGGVDCLKNAVQIYSSSNFSNQYGRHSLWT